MEAESKLRELASSWPHEQRYVGMDDPCKDSMECMNCRRCQLEAALAAHEEGGGASRSTLRHLLVDMLNACGSTMRANQPGEIADRIFKFFEHHRALASQEALAGERAALSHPTGQAQQYNERDWTGHHLHAQPSPECHLCRKMAGGGGDGK